MNQFLVSKSSDTKRGLVSRPILAVSVKPLVRQSSVPVRIVSQCHSVSFQCHETVSVIVSPPICRGDTCDTKLCYKDSAAAQQHKRQAAPVALGALICAPWPALELIEFLEASL
jgi:hypothetical protein